MLSIDDIGGLTLADMEYNGDIEGANPEHGGYNEHYRAILPNGDILRLSCYGYYAGRRDSWEWAVYVPEDYPVQCYQCNYRGHEQPTAEDALLDFFESFKGRKWKSLAEQEWESAPTRFRCLECGWEESDGERLVPVTVYEDYGDVSCLKCPNCGAVQYDGMDIFEEIGG